MSQSAAIRRDATPESEERALRWSGGTTARSSPCDSESVVGSGGFLRGSVTFVVGVARQAPGSIGHTVHERSVMIAREIEMKKLKILIVAPVCVAAWLCFAGHASALVNIQTDSIVGIQWVDCGAPAEDPSDDCPIGIGTVADGGVMMNATGAFNVDGPAWVFIAAQAPAIDPNVTFLLTKDGWMNLSEVDVRSDRSYWDANGPSFSRLFASFGKMQLPEGEYTVYLAISAPGDMSRMRVFLTKWVNSGNAGLRADALQVLRDFNAYSSAPAGPFITRRWQALPIVVAVDPAVVNDPNAGIGQVEAGVRFWTKATGVPFVVRPATFTELANIDSGEIDGIVYVAYGTPSPGDAADISLTTELEGRYLSATIRIDPAHAGGDSGRRLMAHEFGHAIGIWGHTLDGTITDHMVTSWTLDSWIAQAIWILNNQLTPGDPVPLQ